MNKSTTIGDSVIYLGDCREVLQDLPAESVDCVIADPPYGETSLDWDRHVSGWLDACRRVMKPSASLWCFGSLRFFIDRALDFRGWTLAQDVVWEKHNGSGFLSDRFYRVHEGAAQFYPVRCQWSAVYKDPQFDPALPKVGGSVKRRRQPAHTGKVGSAPYDAGRDRLKRSVIFAQSCHGYAIHPTQKPFGIIAPLLAYSCPPAGLVLEPFGGSCSVALAARASGRKSISTELNEEYYAAAVRRLENDGPLLSETAA